ncbi:TlpA family protein disulfide reductase [Deinococcus marmoris]|uniref:TlpA family protein disulfide reductase n=1 Tax=Deinococcus marmoris TaxID=249408 RepID=UPI000495828C|nr:conjugal transfer protein TraF [Deinococcus marmoris]
MSQPAKTPRQIKLKVPPFVGSLLERLFSASTVKPGANVQPPHALKLTRRTLLYFKSEGCVGCDKLDMFIGRLASASGLDLRVIDARRGELPEHGYGEQLLLDTGGRIGRAYRVRVFPTLVLTNPAGEVERVMVGGSSEEEAIRVRLGLT